MKNLEQVAMSLYTHHKMKPEISNMKVLFRRQMTYGMILQLVVRVKNQRKMQLMIRSLAK